MSGKWILLLVVSATLGCERTPPPGPNGPTPITNEFLRKQHECERRAPVDRGKLEASFDYEPTRPQATRPVVWRPKKTYLGETCFIANAGPYYYIGDDGDRELESYSIDVEFAVPDDAAPGKTAELVLFERNIPAGELPRDFERLDIRDIVSYDPTSRKAYFKVGAHQYEYQVPAL